MVHNSYGSASPSGEDTVVEEESQLLRDHGIVVHRYTKTSDGLREANIGRLAWTGLQAPWAWSPLRELSAVLRGCKPDIVHIHNTFPQISYSVVDLCSKSNVPCVVTLHNYRWICSNGVLLRDGVVCTECLDQGSVYPALRHLCFRKSFLATLPIATTIAFNRARGLLAKRVRAVIALTEFQKAQLVRLQVPESKIFVKPNFVHSAESVASWEDRDLDFLFVGRISQEKGLSVLLDAWRRLGCAGPRLTVIGDGRLRLALEASSPSNVDFIGMCSRDQVLGFMRRARALIFPSICFEGFPLAIVEAFSCGLAVLASRIGGIPEIVREEVSGELVEPGNVEAWAQAIRRWTDKPEIVAEMGQNARRAFEQFYTPARNIELLLEVYERALT